MKKSIEQPHDAYGILLTTTAQNDIEQVTEQIRILGYGVLNSGLEVKKINELAEAFDRTRISYQSKFKKDWLIQSGEEHTIRAMLIHGEFVFRELATNSRVVELISSLIRGRFLLNQQNGVINPSHQKYTQGKWHRDLPYQHFVSSSPLSITALYCVDDFTIENGATVVLPATHKTEAYSSSTFVDTNYHQVTAKAGSFIIMDSMLFHKGGVNRTNRIRRAINHVYTIPYIKQQISLPRQMDSQDLTENEKQIFGFDCPENVSIEEFFARQHNG
jgi:ectoine hydroxylase-related dioxygenase (phytanoyl-CoA dioxygenase family)